MFIYVKYNILSLSWSFIIFCLVPPVINDSRHVEDVSVTVGQSIYLNCMVDGIPTPEVQWFRGDELLTYQISPNHRVYDNNRQLQIHNAQLVDSGGYTCKAGNVAGNSSKDYTLTVLCMYNES